MQHIKHCPTCGKSLFGTGQSEGQSAGMNHQLTKQVVMCINQHQWEITKVRFGAKVRTTVERVDV